MPRLPRRRRIHMERHCNIGQRRHRTIQRIRHKLGSRRHRHLIVPANVSALSVAGSIADDAAETGRAICTAVKRSASVPKALLT